MDSSTPWYALDDADALFLQGDFIEKLPIILPVLASVGEAAPPEKPVVDAFGYSFTFDITQFDVVIMSQSCDLENEKLDFVLVCPHWAFSKLEEEEEYLRSTEGRKALRQGSLPGYYLLPACDLEEAKRDVRVIDFRAAQAVPYAYLRAVAGKQERRLRLNSPYRESLSQAYGQFIMRVGLPRNIPPLPKYSKPGNGNQKQ